MLGSERHQVRGLVACCEWVACEGWQFWREMLNGEMMMRELLEDEWRAVWLLVWLRWRAGSLESSVLMRIGDECLLLFVFVVEA